MKTDFHCHILPGIDDGAKNVGQAMRMLRRQKAQGIRRVVATPHFYPQYDTPLEFLRRRDRAEAELRRAMTGEGELPQVEIGAEVYFFRGISQSEVLKDLTIRGKGCMLIELPHGFREEEIFRELEAIWEKRGIVPIIAHIDRYIAPLRTRGLPRKFQELPVMVQANGSFFRNPWTSGLAMKMLKADQIQLIGSDCHNMTDRAPDLDQAAEAIRQKLGPKALARIRRREEQLLGRMPRDC